MGCMEVFPWPEGEENTEVHEAPEWYLAHLPLSSLIHFGGEGPSDRGGEFITLEGDTGVVAVKADSKGTCLRTWANFSLLESSQA